MKAQLIALGLLLFCIVTRAQTPGAGNIIYVNKSVSGSNGSGNSWANAIPELADALKWARQQNNFTSGNPLKIYVAKGTYYPMYSPIDGDNLTAAPTDMRDRAFLMVANAELYGGFDPANGIVQLGDARILGSSGTVLSGDFNSNDVVSGSGNTLSISNNSDNAYHVVLAAGTASYEVKLDGFTIKSGANETSGATQITVGGHTNVYRRAGPAICVAFTSTSALSLRNCNIYESYARFGTLYLYSNGTVNLYNCSVSGNQGIALAFNNNAGTRTVNAGNSTIAGNNSSYINFEGAGAGVVNADNCIIYGNTSGISNAVSSVTKTIRYSLVQGEASNTNYNDVANHNLAAATNPLFTNPGQRDYSLMEGSPAINVGSNSLIPAGITTDLTGNARIVGSTVDMGAYEYTPSCHPSNKVYVDSTATGANDGSSWIDAFTSLSDAIALAHSCTTTDSILVAQGTYYPAAIPPTASATTSRDRSFYFLRNGLVVLGGYPSGGGIRDAAANPTILSGDLDQSGTVTNSDAYHVVVAANSSTGTASVMDGFTIKGGNANILGTIVVNSRGIISNSGGGIHIAGSKFEINNCIITNNRSTSDGAGLFNSSSVYTITNSLFETNNSTLSGGGICNSGGTITMSDVMLNSNVATNDGGGLLSYNTPVITGTNITFTNNRANSGGAYYVNSGNSKFTNSIFAGNRSNGVFGAAVHNGTTNSFINCIFSGNMSGTSGNGSIIYSTSTALSLYNVTISGNNGTALSGSGTPIVRNSIIYNNRTAISGSTPSVNNSLVEGGYSGTGNINADPLFVDAPSYTTAPFTDGNYKLQFCSPAVNAGDNSAIPGGITTDIAGNARIVSTIVDMGAYEKQSDMLNFENNVALSNSSSNALTFIATCDNNDWTYYASPNNPDSLGFAIQWGTNNNTAKAAVTVQLVVEAANTFSSTTPISARAAMRRYWNVDLNSSTMNEPVSLRFYYNPADTLAMYNQLGSAGVGPVSSLQWVKTTGNAYNPSQVSDQEFNGGNYQILTPVYGISNGIAYVQFDNISSFSGGTGTMDAGDAEPLPLELLDFRAAATGNKVQLNWEVATNENISNFEVERSNNGKDWVSVHSTKVQNSLAYQAWDNAPYAGSNYYRLKIGDNAKGYHYSNTQKVVFKGGGRMNITVYPNPTGGNFSIEAYGLGAQVTTVSIQDMLGKTINVLTLGEGKNDFNFFNLSSGTYIIRIQNESNTYTGKISVK